MNIVEVLIVAKNESKKAFAAANADAMGFQQSLRKVGLIGGLALAGIAIEATKMAVNFNTSMLRLQTQAGVSNAKMNVLKQGVLQLAGQVGFSPQSLAESVYHVASNFESLGASAPKMLQVVKTAAEGAKVGGADLVDVTNALTAAVASGIPGVKNYGQAMGALNSIVGTGDMKMQDLADALGTGMLAVVKGFGLSLKDVGAALATFGDNNIRGAAAATQLRMSVQAMAVPAKAGQAQLAAWGYSTNRLAVDMRTGGLLKALNDLHGMFVKNGITAKEQGDIITQMFGKRAGTGLNVLMDQLDRVRSKYPALTKGANEFGSAWQKTQHNLAQQMHELNGSFQALMVTIGEKLIPVVQKVVTWMLKNKTATVIILGLAAAFVALAVAAALVSAAIDANPISLIIIGLVALGIALYEAYKHFKGFRDVVDGVFKNVAHAASNVWNALQNVWHAASNVWHAVTNIWHAASNVWHAVTNVWHAASNVWNAVQNVWHAVSNVWHVAENVWHAITNVWHAAENVWHAITNVWHAVSNVWNAAQNVWHAVTNVWHAVGNVYNVFQKIVGVINTAIGLVGNLGSALSSIGGGAIGKIMSLFGMETGGIVGAATGGVQGGLRMVGERGPELVRLPRGSMVYPSGTSAGMPTSGKGHAVNVTFDFRGPGGNFQQFLISAIRYAVIDQGGGDVQKAFGVD